MNNMTSPFHHHERGSMSPQRRAKIFAAAGGRCHKCSRKLGPADYWEAEHVASLATGGDDEDGNIRPICEWCLPEKNAEDAEARGHMRRSYTKHVVPSSLRRKGKGWRK